MTMMKNRDRDRDREIGHVSKMSRHLSCHVSKLIAEKRNMIFEGK